MYFIDKIIERICFARSFFLRDQRIKDMQLTDFLHAMFKSAVLRRLLTGPVKMEYDGVVEGCREIRINDKRVCWPEEADPKNLLYTYWEVFHDKAGHMFDTRGTELRAGDVVLDCGTCEGLFSVKALEKGARKVYCFEPSHRMCRCLNVRFGREIREGRVEVIDILLGDRTDTLMFKDNPHDPSTGKVIPKSQSADQSVYPVGLSTVDEFCMEHGLSGVSYIKADVEGAEVELVRGALDTIVRFSPRLSLAVYHNADNARDIVSLIRSVAPGYSFAYSGLSCAGGVVRPMILHCKNK